MITVYLISWVGYATYSELMARITSGVFIVLFFNTGILILLANANMSNFSPFLGKMFDKKYYDYSPNWY